MSHEGGFNIARRVVDASLILIILLLKISESS
jgi:hypothetical protein